MSHLNSISILSPTAGAKGGKEAGRQGSKRKERPCMLLRRLCLSHLDVSVHRVGTTLPFASGKLARKWGLSAVLSELL